MKLKEFGPPRGANGQSSNGPWSFTKLKGWRSVDFAQFAQMISVALYCFMICKQFNALYDGEIDVTARDLHIF